MTLDPTWLRRRYLQDRAPVTVLADEAGVDVSTVYRALRQYDLTGRGHATAGRPSWGAVLTAAYLRSHADRSSLSIAREVGCDRATVRYWRSRHGLREDALPKREAAQLRRWYDRDGESIAAIAARLGIGTREATLRLTAAGIQIRARGRKPAS